MRGIIAKAIFLGVMLISTLAWGQDSLNVTKVGEVVFWESLTETAIAGNFIYASAGSEGIRVFDFSDLQELQEVAYFNTLGTANRIVLDSIFAYVADGPGGLRILDISDPANPVEAGFCETPADAMALAVRGDIAYLADAMDCFRTIDISNPFNPVEMACLAYGSGYGIPAHAVAVSGNYAYLSYAECGCGWGGKLYNIDIADPSHPRVEDSLSTGYVGASMEATDSVLYVGTMGNACGVFTYGIDNPPGIHYLSWYIPPGDVTDIRLCGDTLYCVGYYFGLQALEVSNPLNPFQIGNYPCYFGWAANISIADSLAFVTGYNAGITALNISRLDSISAISTLRQLMDLKEVVLKDTLAFVTNADSGLCIFNVSSPQEPRLLTRYPLAFSPYGMDVEGQHCFLTKYSGSLIILDISDPLNPMFVHEEEYFFAPMGIEIQGNLAYLGSLSDGLIIVDISNPIDPDILGFVDIPGYTLKVTVEGDYAYAAVDNNGLVILDISNPADPAILGSVSNGEIRDVGVTGSIACFTECFGGLFTVDVSNPLNPYQLGFCDIPGDGHDLHVAGNWAYVAGEYSGMRVVSLENASLPVETGFYDLESDANGLAIAGNYAYVGADNYFVVLDHSQASPVADIKTEDIPQTYALRPPHPNPFNAQTKIILDLPKAGHVQLIVYDVQGKLCVTLLDDQLSAGRHEVTFNGGDFSSGIYLAKVEAGDFREVQKMVLVK